jgi:hypothetical protein
MPSGLTYIEKQFCDFQAAYANQNYGLATDAFVGALWANPGIAYRYFVARSSAAVGTCLIETARVSEIANWLDGIFADFSDMHLLTDYDPNLIRRLVDLREENVVRGLPSIVLAAQGKSGSVSIANIFNSGFNLPSFAYSLINLEVVDSWARDYARGGACYTTHLLPETINIERLKRAGLQKVIVHVRDPRQALLSFLHHISAYPDQFPAIAQRGLRDLDMSAQLSKLSPFYFSYIRWIQGWIDAEHEIDILFSTFEDFIRDRRTFIERYIEYYGGHLGHFSWENATNQHAGVDYHFRAGLRDEWRVVFAPRDAERLTALLPLSIRERFGWGD